MTQIVLVGHSNKTMNVIWELQRAKIYTQAHRQAYKIKQKKRDSLIIAIGRVVRAQCKLLPTLSPIPKSNVSISWMATIALQLSLRILWLQMAKYLMLSVYCSMCTTNYFTDVRSHKIVRRTRRVYTQNVMNIGFREM